MARRIGAHHDRLGREPDQRDAGLPLDVLAEPRIPALLVGSEIPPEDRPGDGGVEREDLRSAAETLGEEEVGDAIDLRGGARPPAAKWAGVRPRTRPVMILHRNRQTAAPERMLFWRMIRRSRRVSCCQARTTWARIVMRSPSRWPVGSMA